MKLLLVNHTFRSDDGQGYVNQKVAEHLLRQGHHLTLVGADFPRSFQDHERATLIEVVPRKYPSKFLRNLSFATRTAQVINDLRGEHDVTVVNGGMTWADADVNVCHFVHASWIGAKCHPFRTGRFPWNAYQLLYSYQGKLWEKVAYRRARLVVAVSELVRQQLIDDVGIPPSQIVVIENGLDVPDDRMNIADQTVPSSRRAEIGIGPDQFVIFFAGELKTPRKNFDTLLAALQRLPDRMHLVAAGVTDGGPYPQLAREMGLGDRVHFLGHRRDVRALYSMADCFVFVSHYDPFALVVAEAITAGLPVVTAKTVGAASLVERHDCGLVLESPADVQGVVDAILRLEADGDYRRRVCANSELVHEELAWDRVGNRYEVAIDRLVEDDIEHSQAMMVARVFDS